MNKAQKDLVLNILNKEIGDREQSMSYRRGASRDWCLEELTSLKLAKELILKA